MVQTTNQISLTTRLTTVHAVWEWPCNRNVVSSLNSGIQSSDRKHDVYGSELWETSPKLNRLEMTRVCSAVDIL